MSKSSLSMMVQVKSKVQEAEEIVRFELVDPHGRELPDFTAGAHLDVQTDAEHMRQYSLSNAPSQTHRYQIAVLRETDSRGGSVAMHDTVQEGDLIQISAPRNHFALDESAQKTLLLAAGIGITPLLAMAEQLHAEGREFELHYVAKTRARMAFLNDLSAAPYADKVHFYFTQEEGGSRPDIAALAASPNADTHLYVCGPNGFIDSVLDTFKEAGWNSKQLHTEYFEGADIDTSDDGSFEVELASTGAVYVIPADKTVAEVLIDNDVDLLTSCEQGICGTCVTRVLEGTPEHRDLYLDEDEHAANDVFTPCCSRSKSPRLKLDL
ncbi:MAG: PDR/VanB family oxidoreductase [Saccharospirillum sp.]